MGELRTCSCLSGDFEGLLCLFMSLTDGKVDCIDDVVLITFVVIVAFFSSSICFLTSRICALILRRSSYPTALSNISSSSSKSNIDSISISAGLLFCLCIVLVTILPDDGVFLRVTPNFPPTSCFVSFRILVLLVVVSSITSSGSDGLLLGSSDLSGLRGRPWVLCSGVLPLNCFSGVCPRTELLTVLLIYDSVTV